MESYSKPSNQQAIEQKNALDFLDQIRREFADNGQVYNEFLNIMAEFRINQIDPKQLLLRAAMLFEGHPSLINQFIQFLPPGHMLAASET